MKASNPLRLPGSIAIAIVVSLMFVTPVLAATTLNPIAIRWNVLLDFIGAHTLGVMLGLVLMIVVLVGLGAAIARRSPQPGSRRPIALDAAVHDVVGLA